MFSTKSYLLIILGALVRYQLVSCSLALDCAYLSAERAVRNRRTETKTFSASRTERNFKSVPICKFVQIWNEMKNSPVVKKGLTQELESDVPKSGPMDVERKNTNLVISAWSAVDLQVMGLIRSRSNSVSYIVHENGCLG